MVDINKDEHGDVVSLKGYRQTMTYNPIAEVEAYWEALRGTRLVPLRSEIDPRGIERALDSTFLLERIAPGLARFRLAGMRLNEIMGMEVRGMPMTSVLTPDARDEAREALNQLFEGPSIVTASLEAASGIGRPALRGRMVLLPLKSDLGDISRAIGCLSLDGKIGRVPRRFGITSLTYRAVGPFKTTQPAEPVAPALPTPDTATADTGMSEAPAPFRGKADDTRPKLRLIKTDELNNRNDD